MEYFPNLLDLLHIQIWEEAHTEALVKKKNITEVGWINFLSTTFKVDQSDVCTTSRASCHQASHLCEGRHFSWATYSDV